MRPSSAATCCTLAAVVALYVILQPLVARGGEEEGSSEGHSNVLLLYSGAEEAAGWFRVSIDDTLFAARLACKDIAIAALALLGGSGSPLNTIELLVRPRARGARLGCACANNMYNKDKINKPSYS